MKRNILTIIILAMALINIVMSAVLIFVIVPTSNKTNKLVSKVAQLIDLELESPENAMDQISVSDIETYEFEEKMTLNLAKSDEEDHYAMMYLSLSMNMKHEDYTELQPYVSQYENEIKEIVGDEFSKYTIDNVMENKNKIKEQVLIRIQELFRSDFIINVSFGSILYD